MSVPKKISRTAVKYIMENDIAGDIIYDSTKVSRLHKELKTKLERVEDARDLFFVMLSSDTKEIEGIITIPELKKILQKTPEKKITKADINQNPSTINYKSSISVALDKFADFNTNVILVTNENNRYMGKIKRSNFKDRLEEFLVSV